MGQNQSVFRPIVDPHDTRPTSLRQCKSGFYEYDKRKLRLYRQREDEEMENLNSSLLGLLAGDQRSDDDSSEGDEEPAVKKRRKSKRPAMYTADDGTRRRLDARMTMWYDNYVSNPNTECPSFQKKFRRRFRLPHAKFVELSEALEESDIFSRWKEGQKDVCHLKAAPISLLLLCTLRYLGRGWTFDDCAESCAISEEVVRVFFHCFVMYGSTVLYEKYVKYPQTAEEAKNHMAEFAMAGLPGALGSTDATHVLLERVLHAMRQAHLGFKMSHTARTYNVTVNHRRRILCSTKGHPARWNDKTLALFDEFMNKIQDGAIMDDAIFELYDYDEWGNVIRRKYQGVWLVVDNGYLAWPTTVPPMKTTTDRREIRFSAWLESMRKDVECTFGIMKGRFRILKTGIRVHGVDSADRIWLTCCALHNWLLEIDGLDKKWEDGVPSDWEGELGQHESSDLRRYADPVRRLNSPVAARTYDMSGIGVGDDRARPENPQQELVTHASQRRGDHGTSSDDDIQVVRNLSLNYFRSKLVTHFDIAFKRREVVWPKRTGRPEPAQDI
jgi:hypothetical protein